jgi:hypothetical protein
MRAPISRLSGDTSKYCVAELATSEGKLVLTAGERNLLLKYFPNGFTVSPAARLSIKLTKSFTRHIDFTLLKVIHYMFRPIWLSSGVLKL